MQALNTIGKRVSSEAASAQQAAKVAEVWRTIIGSCAIGDTLVLDFIVPPSDVTLTTSGGASSKKVATFSGSVSAIIDKSKKAPKIMFRAEGFREQVQLPPVLGLEGAKGSDTASLLEFLTTSKLVGAAVLRKDRADNVVKAVLSLGTRSKAATAAAAKEKEVKESSARENAADLEEKPASKVAPLPSPPKIIKDEVKPEPEDDTADENDAEHPHFLLTAEQKRSYLNKAFDRLFVDESTAVHVGATMLLSLLKNETQVCRRSSDLALSSNMTTRFQSIYASDGVGPAFKAPKAKSSGVLPAPDGILAAPDGVLPLPHQARTYDDEETQDWGRINSEEQDLKCKDTCFSSKQEWDAVGSGAFACVYKVAPTATLQCSLPTNPAAVKIIRNLLHSSEEGDEMGQLPLFQKVTSDINSFVVADHSLTCPSVVKALALPTKVAFGLSQPSLDFLRNAVGLNVSRSRLKACGDGNELVPITEVEDTVSVVHDQLRPSFLRSGQNWYERPLPILTSTHADSVGILGKAPDVEYVLDNPHHFNTNDFEIIDVMHMEDEAGLHALPFEGVDGRKLRGSTRKRGGPRISFYPFSREVELLLEWKELMEGELLKNHPHQVDALRTKRTRDRDTHDIARWRRAHAQHCYSFIIGVHEPRAHARELLQDPTKTKTCKPSGTLSVADIFASRRVVEPCAACGMTIQRPVISLCRLGFTSGSMGVRQSAVGELFNLQLCSGKEKIIRLVDWGYRGVRIRQFAEMAISFITDMTEHTHVGKAELLDFGNLTYLTHLFGKRHDRQHVASPAISSQTPLSFPSRVIARHLGLGFVNSSNAVATRGSARNMQFSLQDPLFPSLDHLLVCTQAHLSCLGLMSLLEGVGGIVMPFCNQPLNKLQRKLVGMVSDRRNVAEVINAEVRDRLGLLRRMKLYLETKKEQDEQNALGISYLPQRPASLTRPNFDNPFGYTLESEDTLRWIAALPQLERMYESISGPHQSGNALRSAPLARLAASLPTGVPPTPVAGETLDESPASLLLPSRFSERKERLMLAVGVLKDLAIALESLHSSDVIHRDVKPNNIMVIREYSYVVPLTENLDKPMTALPKLLFELLDKPSNLLERTRCSFHLIDLGWGRLLPSATIGLPPYPQVQNQIQDEERNGDFGDEPTYIADEHSDPVIRPPPSDSCFIPLRPLPTHLASSYANPIPTLPPWSSEGVASTPTYANPTAGYKRPRDEDTYGVPHGEASFLAPPIPSSLSLPVIRPMPASLTLQLAPQQAANVPPQPSAFDPRLFSMQRKVAAFGSGYSRPTDPVEGLTFSDLEQKDRLVPLAAANVAAPFIPISNAKSENNLPTDEEDDVENDDPIDDVVMDEDIRDFLLSGPAGNMCYRAPEFMIGAHEHFMIPGACGPDGSKFNYTPSVDVFALGTVLFELLTGTRLLKIRPQELSHSELRNGHLLQRMVESLGYPKVWVAEVVVRMRGTRRSGYPLLLTRSPFATARIRSQSALRVAQQCIDQLETFLSFDSIRKNRILDALNVDVALAYAYEEVVIATASSSRMLTMTDASGGTGSDVFCEADNDFNGTRDGLLKASSGSSGKLKPYAIVPVRLLGQHGYAGMVYDHESFVAHQYGGFKGVHGNVPKRPATSVFVLHFLSQGLAPAWGYALNTESKMGFKSLSEVEVDRAEAGGENFHRSEIKVRGTFSNASITFSDKLPSISDADAVAEMVGLVTRMLAWEPSERPTLREVLKSGCFQLLCGDGRGSYDL